MFPTPDNDPDYFVKSIIKNIGSWDKNIEAHLTHCKECKSVLAVSLNVAIKNMMNDPTIQKAMNIMAIHMKNIGA